MGGRLANAPVPFNQKHLIILAPNNPLTLLIIHYEHLRLLHAGCQTTLAVVRTQYWPLSGKNAIKKVLRKCIKCCRAKPIGTEYLMANLHSSRVTPSRAFNTTGVDYAGPFYIIDKLRSRTTIKTYLCVFVCFATKAVHLELARDISTDTFMHCLQRFISRRGLCQALYSDNGTNFVGARNELPELHALLMNNNFQRDVREFLVNQQISWHMIPPNAPHFGGLWESAVKSAKTHLYCVVGDTRLTYEELYTVLTQVESCLNSRPLNPLSNDPNDLRPLTPGHFLTGDSLNAIPQPGLREIPRNRLSRYQHLQQMLKHFWQRWQRVYLSQLQERRKWAQPVDNRLLLGTMVVVRDDDLPPLKWQLGRITECHPGQDGTIQVVSIQMGHSVLKRPVSKVCILPIDE
ncbi:uncharacterized protein LOC117176426 [Belonocnema kinseyi]|uniref:uncharacterized protein LOC117176426 n=1 Tax=Belonocnema kinseyi TaxID=2817044 RepID=UPI00143D2916|nr:uncharacterized protein LOC117176426 [Belonocnema kinseyi]